MQVDKSKEYEMLRAEMMEGFKAITQYQTVLYTAVATILVFALQKDAFYLCLVPYIVILPLYLLSEDKNRANCKIAAYMYVYLEGEDFFWERRHHDLDKETPHTARSIIPYICLSLACSACAIYKIIIIQRSVLEYVIRIGIVVIVSIIIIFIISKKRTNYVAERKNFIEKWEAQKNAEEAKGNKTKETTENV